MRALLFLLCLPLLADDKPAPTIEQLQAQIAQRDAYIQYLENMNAAINRKVSACFSGMNAQLEITSIEAQRPPRPTPAKGDK